MGTPRQLGLNKKSRFAPLCHSSKFAICTIAMPEIPWHLGIFSNLYDKQHFEIRFLLSARIVIGTHCYRHALLSACIVIGMHCYRHALLSACIVIGMHFITTCVSSWQIGNQNIDFGIILSRRMRVVSLLLMLDRLVRSKTGILPFRFAFVSIDRHCGDFVTL